MDVDVKRLIVFAVLPVWLSVGCAGVEQEVLDRYLEASQRGDNATVAALSMVAFPEDVESWNILEISDERRDPARNAAGPRPGSAASSPPAGGPVHDPPGDTGRRRPARRKCP